MLNNRVDTITGILTDYVRSPSLRHLRDRHSVTSLARKIVRKLDGEGAAWQKWTAAREELAKAASPCWIPLPDLQDHLNAMAGPVLTTTDVAQRLCAFQEENNSLAPNENLKAGCQSLYAAERDAGTEMLAIIGALREYIEVEERRFVEEWAARAKRKAEQERLVLEQRFRSGADCKWTPLEGSKELYCRINGRSYRLSAATGGRWDLYRFVSDRALGVLVGTYRSRRDVNETLKNVAYGPDLVE